MREIRGNAKNLRALLMGEKFKIDYYQREYRWETKQIRELIEDLAEKFGEDYQVGDPRSAVEKYGHYFLGSIIICERDGSKFIIDGQQRLTSLTLLLIHVLRSLGELEQNEQIANLIFSKRYGDLSFNLDIDEREECMEALYFGNSLDESEQSESVANILNRYQDITELFPEDLIGEALPFFSDWLIENVYLVEITAYSDADAYTIFETMNDRGLSLTPTDMLKGYLLANIGDVDRRNTLNGKWREQISVLQEIGKEEDADAIKAWLRSQHADTIRERKRGAQPLDFDLIGTEFHRWVRDREDSLGLTSSSDFTKFIEEDFIFYSKWYALLREMAHNPSQDIESVFFCAQNNFTLQYPVLLAPLRREDSDPEVLRKLRVVSAFLDILISRRIWNRKANTYNTMQYAMFLVMKEIRGKDVATLVKKLHARLEDSDETFANNERFGLHGTNGRQIHLLLARMVDFVETNSGRESHFQEYVNRQGKNGFEVEHIWANHPENHRDEFSHPQDFQDYRNRIGGLLILPKSFNSSYGDLPYVDKRDQYLKHNLLAQSLHEKAYEYDPGFIKFKNSSGLAFTSHEFFRKVDLDKRQALYRDLAEQVWNPKRLEEAAES